MPTTSRSVVLTTFRALALALKKYKDTITVTLSIAAFLTSALNYYVANLWHVHDVRIGIRMGPLRSETEEIPVVLVNAGKHTEVFVGAKFTHGRAPTNAFISSNTNPFSVLVLRPGEVREITVKNDTSTFAASVDQLSKMFNPLPEDTLNAYLEFTYIDANHKLAIARAKVGEIVLNEHAKKAMGVVFTDPEGLVPIF